MRFHLPKPRDGWRVFVGEVGVIVIGVVIALVAQQFAENWQWRQTVERTKSDLDDQIHLAIANSAERVAVTRAFRSGCPNWPPKWRQAAASGRATPIFCPVSGQQKALSFMPCPGSIERLSETSRMTCGNRPRLAAS